MPEASDIRGILRRNLIGAGCGPGAVQACMALAQNQKTAAAKAAEIAPAADEIAEPETLGGAAGINTLSKWEKEMRT